MRGAALHAKLATAVLLVAAQAVRPHSPQRRPPACSRRQFAAAAGASLLCLNPPAASAVAISDAQSKLVWEPRAELPKRGRTAIRYQKVFVAYLARFLLNF